MKNNLDSLFSENRGRVKIFCLSSIFVWHGFSMHSSRHLAFSYHFLFPKHRWYRCTTLRRKRRTNSEFPIIFAFLVFKNEITSWFQLCERALYQESQFLLKNFIKFKHGNNHPSRHLDFYHEICSDWDTPSFSSYLRLLSDEGSHSQKESLKLIDHHHHHHHHHSDRLSSMAFNRLSQTVLPTTVRTWWLTVE